jgi:hypothetical protein
MIQKSEIGSLPWRVSNYGVFATLQHLGLRSRTLSRGIKIPEIDKNEFLEILGVSEKLSIIEFMINDCLFEMNQKREIENNQYKIKNVSDVKSSKTRLFAIIAIISTSHYENFIETGTQHGISAFVAGKAMEKFQSKGKVFTFDARQNILLGKFNNCVYYVLPEKLRANFKKITLSINPKKAVFFHDSDHTYENMLFEFNWAWNVLKVDVLISDDISGNSAFLDFCVKNKIKGYVLKFDDGPAVGYANRKDA